MFISRIPTCLCLVLLGGACVIPSFNPLGKSCTEDNQCPAPFICGPATDGPRHCSIASSVEPDAGSLSWWKPLPGESWQIQLSEDLDLSIDAKVFAFEIDQILPSVAEAIHQKGGHLICRIRAGVGAEDDPEIQKLPSSAVGTIAYGNFRWIDLRIPAVVELLTARLDDARLLGCDGVTPTWLDGYGASTGLGLGEADAASFLVTLGSIAHARGLSIGLDNSIELADAVVTSVDWAMNESCVKYAECDRLQPIAQSQKAVFHYEIGDASKVSSVCAETKSLGFSTIIKTANVGAWRGVCP